MQYLYLLFGVFLLVGPPALFSAADNPVLDAFEDTPQKEQQGGGEVQLSLERQVGQMFLVGFEGKEVTPELVSMLQEIQPGGVLLLGRNIESAEQVSLLIQDLQELSSIPLFVAVDQEGGIVSRAWWQESTASSFLLDQEHAFDVGSKRARGLKALGITMNLAPVLDSKGKEDFVYPRFFQKEDALSLELAQGLLLGHESEGVIAVPKHFPGYDGISFNPEEGIVPKVSQVPDVSLFQELFQAVPFPFLMVSYVVFEDLDKRNPFPFSKAGIAFLKEKMGEEVLVMSDDSLSKSMVKNYPVSGIGAKAALAGVDVLLAVGYPQVDAVLRLYRSLVRETKIHPELQARVRESATKILQVKQEWYGF